MKQNGQRLLQTSPAGETLESFCASPATRDHETETEAETKAAATTKATAMSSYRD